MHVYPLGIGGFIPTADRDTASYLVVEGQTAVLFDTGTGVRKLALPEIRAALADVTEMKVILTHFHLDHTCGFPWLLRLWEKPLDIYVPSQPHIEADGRAAISALTSQPNFALPVGEWPQVRTLEVVRDGMSLGFETLHIVKQQHAGGSIGVRLGGFAYITDCTPDPALHVPFLQGAELVFMDTMYAEPPEGVDASAQHGDPVTNGRIAKAASVGQLGLVHLDPGWDEADLRAVEARARGQFERSMVPRFVCAEVGVSAG